MSIRKLDRAEWSTFCDDLSKTLLGKRAEVRITSPALGSQVEADWLPVLGIVYDEKSDMIEVALEGLDHMIREPREFDVESNVNGVANLQIVDGDGAQHIVTMRDPLMLPSH